MKVNQSFLNQSNVDLSRDGSFNMGQRSKSGGATMGTTKKAAFD
jgi:hypothetical protein